MATRIQPWLVGIFTLVGLTLIVGGFILLGSGRLFSQYRTVVVFFPDPVGGLKEGSPVSFRLAPIGQVREIELVFTGSGYASETRVIADIRKGSLREAGKLAVSNLDDRAWVDAFVKAGLRAGIHSSSPVAGQKSLNFDILPERKARFSGLPSPYPEVPTAPSGLKVLQEKIESTLDKVTDLPINEVVLQLKATLESVETVLEDDNVTGAVKDLRMALQSTDRVLKKSEGTVDNVDGLVGDVRRTMANLDGTLKRLESTFDKLDRTLTTADKTFASVDRTLTTVDRSVDQTVDTQYDAKQAIEEMNDLLRSLRHLLESIQKSPESILRGKPAPGKK